MKILSIITDFLKLKVKGGLVKEFKNICGTRCVFSTWFAHTELNSPRERHGLLWIGSKIWWMFCQGKQARACSQLEKYLPPDLTAGCCPMTRAWNRASEASMFCINLDIYKFAWTDVALPSHWAGLWRMQELREPCNVFLRVVLAGDSLMSQKTKGRWLQHHYWGHHHHHHF